MNVELISYTHNASILCARAAKSCYSDSPASEIELSKAKAAELLKKTIKSGHHSVLEHAVYTFSIAGVSRVLTHQLVRHRMASYSQSSQRYVKLDEPSFVYPFNDEEDSSIQSVFIDAMHHAWKAYNELLEMGVSEEDARYVLPNACTTNIVVTMNARELLHFFKLRCCNRAQNEIRELAYEMLTLCIQKDPLIFDNAGPPCRFGECPETNPCGNSPYYNRI